MTVACETVILRSWDAMSEQQTAEVLDCSPNSVKVHTHRALATVRAPHPGRLCAHLNWRNAMTSQTEAEELHEALHRFADSLPISLIQEVDNILRAARNRRFRRRIAGIAASFGLLLISLAFFAITRT